jgi:hypothetical protein
MSENNRSAVEAFKDWVRENHARQPSVGAELRAMGREAMKDVRSTMHEVFFGQREGFGEPGAPLNSTMAEISKDRGVVDGFQSVLDSYAERGSVYGQGHEQSQGHERSQGPER